MRLLTSNDQGELRLTKDFLDDVPPYAILSHTWGADEEEITFEDLKNGLGKNKPGYTKLQFCKGQARNDNLTYFWVDTCCINKDSHTELSEAITSMFRWYHDAVKCYVYLSDVSACKRHNDSQAGRTWESEFRKSRWFTRGWTLQELLAPKSAEFFSRDGGLLGSKKTLEGIIHEITNIPTTALHGASLSKFSVEERLRWAARRNTKRIEDKAYCLLGLFEIYMPLIYGEGANAWHRLKEEIDRRSSEVISTNELLLEKLAYVSDAPFTSYTNQRHRPCLENTRVEVLNDIVQWATSTSTRCIFWLKGMAGTGKSTVAISVASRLRQMSPHMASFFFRRGFGDLAHARKLISTIVRQLALSSPAYCRLVLANIKADPDLGHSVNLRDQYEKLIVEPLYMLQSSATSQHHFFVVIDALDECDEEKDLRLLLRLLATTKDISTLNLRVLVTSRPEWVIQQGFQDMPTILYQDLVLHNMPREMVDRDIEIYLRHELELVQHDRNLPFLWPDNTHISTLVSKSAGLFIFAATACRHIAGSPQADPQERLEQVCASIAQNHLMTEELDQMYTIVLQNSVNGRYTKDERKRIASRFRRVVGSIIMLLTPLSVSNLFRILEDTQISKRYQLEDTLRPLYAIIDVPNGVSCPVLLLHLSFRDFLLDPDRCIDEQFQVNGQQIHEDLTWDCIRLLSSSLRQNICQLPTSTISISDITRSDIDDNISPSVQYACQYWAAHLQKGKVELGDENKVHEFFRKHFLHWLEVMSLIGKISDAIIAITDLVAIVDSRRSPVLSDFIHDCRRFLLAFRQVISEAPGQVYESALFFSPLQSTIRKTFSNTIPTNYTFKPLLPEKWSACLQTLEGHSNEVNTVVFSPDNQLVASGSLDGTVRLWDIRTGDSRTVLRGHSKGVCNVAFSPDGQLVASASLDGTVRLWDVQTGDPRAVLEGHSDGVNTVVFSPDGQLVASGSFDCTVRLWEVQTGDSHAVLRGHSDMVVTVVFSPDGQLVASGSNDGRLVASGSGDHTVRLWEVQTGDPCAVFRGHSAGVNTVVFSPNGQLMASGSRDSTVRLWDVQTGDSRAVLEGHSDWVNTVVFSPNGQLVASGSQDDTVRLWEVQTGDSRAVLEAHSSVVEIIVFSPDGQLVASASLDGTVRLWDVQTGDSRAVLKGHSDGVDTVVFSPDGQLMASGSSDRTVRLWEVQTGDSHAVLKVHSSEVLIVVFSPDGQLVASASGDGTIRLWDVQTGDSRAVLEGHSDRVNTVVFSPDGQLVASGSDDGTVRLWEVQTGDPCAVFRDHSSEVLIVVFSPDGQLMASGSFDRTVRLWNVQTGDSHAVLEGHSDKVNTVVFSPDGQLVASGSNNGRLVASGSGDHTVRLWEVQTGDPCAVFRGHSAAVNTVVFSPDGQLMASGSRDSTVRLWDVQTGDPRAVLRGHSDGVRIVVFSPDGQLVASGSRDGTVRLWDIQTAKQNLKMLVSLLPRRLEFHPSLDLLYINGTAFSMSSGILATECAAQKQGMASKMVIFAAGEWVIKTSLRVLWLPPEHRPYVQASRENVIVFGFTDGRVTFLSWDS